MMSEFWQCSLRKKSCSQIKSNTFFIFSRNISSFRKPEKKWVFFSTTPATDLNFRKFTLVELSKNHWEFNFLVFSKVIICTHIKIYEYFWIDIWKIIPSKITCWVIENDRKLSKHLNIIQNVPEFSVTKKLKCDFWWFFEAFL